MLKQRVGAAVVLILAFLGALFYFSSPMWAGLMGIVALGAAWEWSRLCSLSGISRGLYTLVVGIVLFTFQIFADARMFQGLMFTILVFWFVLAPVWLIRHWAVNRYFLLLVGLIVLTSTCVAFIHLREIDSHLLLFLMGLVWVADSAAYFSGRRWGKHKLAPRISPGKTWEGVLGALVVALAYVGGVAGPIGTWCLDARRLAADRAVPTAGRPARWGIGAACGICRRAVSSRTPSRSSARTSAATG